MFALVRAAVLVSGGGANLQPILDMCLSGDAPELALAAVISSAEGAFALERARRAEIPCYVVERALFPNNASFCNALLNKLRDVDAEIVACAGFAETLNYPLLHYYKNRVIAAQPVLFPAYCQGTLDPVRAVKDTIDRGVRVTGATAYFMTEDDNGFGPIILQEAVEVREGDTPAALAQRIMTQGEQSVLPRALRLASENRLRVIDGRVWIMD